MKKKKEKKITKKQIKKQLKREIKQLDLYWQKSVRERDGNKCVICGSTEKLNVHHIIPRENAFFRHEQANGIVLCVLHHRFSFEISPHQAPFNFFNWMQDNREEQMNILREKWKLWKQMQKENIQK